MEWINLFETQPDKNAGHHGYVFIRNVNTKCGTMILIEELLKLDGRENIEWLDESPTLSPEGMYSREQVVEIIKKCASSAKCTDPYQEGRRSGLRGIHLDGYIANNPAKIDKQSILSVIASLPSSTKQK